VKSQSYRPVEFPGLTLEFITETKFHHLRTANEQVFFISPRTVPLLLTRGNMVDSSKNQDIDQGRPSLIASYSVVGNIFPLPTLAPFAIPAPFWGGEVVSSGPLVSKRLAHPASRSLAYLGLANIPFQVREQALCGEV
jgi:hypothetical protein